MSLTRYEPFNVSAASSFNILSSTGYPLLALNVCVCLAVGWKRLP